MKVIPIIHRLIHLSTLKRSWLLAISTLKRSWVYAETLLRSIYTCIYLYKKTCSRGQQAVNKSFFVKIKSISFVCLVMITTPLLTSCQKTIWVPALRQPDLRISQHPATITQPPKYYVCGNVQYPCRPVTYKWQAASVRHINKHKSVSRHHPKLMINKPQEHQYEVPRTVKSCKIPK
jgi:hypothetical protein